MDEFKIENFLASHEGKQFPSYRPLTADQADAIRKKLLDRLGIDPHENGLTLVCHLAQMEKSAQEFSVQDSGFDLTKVLDSLEVHPETNVYINWYRFDRIDEIAAADLHQYFDDIWYPAVDDIDLFDATLSWVLSVSHDGKVRATKLDVKG